MTMTKDEEQEMRRGWNLVKIAYDRWNDIDEWSDAAERWLENNKDHGYEE